MKKIILTALLGIPVTVFAQSGQFDLKAKAGNANKPAMAYLIYNKDGKQVIDTAAVANGSFEFKGTIADPVHAQLVLDHEGRGLKNLSRSSADVLPLFLEKGNLSISSKDSVKKAEVTGSKVNTEYAAYKKFIAAPDKQMAALNAEYSAASAEQRKDAVYSKQMESKYNKAEEEEKALQLQFIKQNPGSFLSLMALTDVAGSTMNVAKIDPVYKSLSADIRNSAAGLQFAKQIAAARATSIGAMAPVFTQNDVNDKPVSLTDFHGKYVLLDFWASWCGPCRGENPNVVKAYQQYKNKNFTVLGVSLDQPGKKDAWLAAIKADGLEWTQVSDLKYWNNDVAKLYGIRSIPQNYLIDPTGKIIGKNLRGEELNAKLKEVLGAQL